MNADGNDSPDRQQRLNEVLAEYLEALERGEAQDRQAWLARYPEFADELADLFASQDELAPLRSPPVVPPGKIRYFGDYELLEEIGRGGMGVVYKATQTSLKRTVAVKMIMPRQLASESDIRRFRMEAEAVAQLQHPGIVAIHEVGEHDGYHYFSMDYVEGRNLDRLIVEKPLEPARAARYVQQVAESIHYAHEQGILHRDVKPSNVIVDTDDHPRITDFGLAKKLETDSGLTSSGEIVGSPSYMSPEQATADREQVGPHSDVYSIGATLYALLTGRPPFQAASLADTLSQVRDAEPVSPRDLNPAVPRDLETICLKCLEKEPSRRYVSARELADDLQRYLKGKPILARPVGRVERLWRWCKRKPVVAGLGVALVSTLLIGTVVSTYFAFRSEALRKAADNQWQRAETEREQADRAREKEAAERQKAQRASQEASRAYYRASAERKKLTTLLYYLHITSAYQRWLDKDIPGAEEYLNACTPATRRWEWGYLKWMCNPCLITCGTQTVWVHCVAFDPECKRIAVGGVPGGEIAFALQTNVASAFQSLTVLDLSSGDRLLNLAGHAGLAQSLAFSHDGARIASGSHNGIVTIWDAATGARLQTLEGEANGIKSIAFSPDGKHVGTGSADGTMTVWNLHEHRQLFTLRGHANGVASVAFSSDGTQLAFPGADRAVPVVDVYTGRQLLALKGHESEVRSVKFSPDGTKIVSGDDDGLILFWDASTGQKLRSLAGHAGSVESIAFSPDGRRIVSGGRDCAVRIWDATTGTQLFRFQGHDNNVVNAAFSPDGTRITSCSCLGNAKVWDATASAKAVEFESHTGRVNCVAFDANGERIASGCDDCTVRLWDAATGREEQTFKGHTRSVTSVAFGPYDWIASASEDGTVRLWHTTSGREAAVLDEHTGPIRSVAFGPKGNTIAAGGELLRIWSVDGLQPPVPLPTLPPPPPELQGEEVQIGADGAPIAASSPESAESIGSGVSVKELVTLKGHAKNVESLAFSPDGERIAVGSSDGTVTMWDLQTARELLAIEGHSKRVVAVAFSPNLDGARIASAGADGIVKVWDASTGVRVLSFERHAEGVTSMAYSPDGERIASSSVAGTILVWDAPTGQVLLALTGTGNADSIRAVAFSPDGTLLASACADGTVGVRPCFQGEHFAIPGLIASGGNDGTVRIWDGGTAQGLGTLEAHEDSVTCVTFSPDGARIASGSRDSTVKLWELVTEGVRDPPLYDGVELLTSVTSVGSVEHFGLGLPDTGKLAFWLEWASLFDSAGALTKRRRMVEELRNKTRIQQTFTLEGHRKEVTSVAFRPGGEQVASGSLDDTVKIWDATTGLEMHTLKGHSGDVNIVAYGPHGKRIVSGSNDHTLKLWNAANGQNTHTFRGHRGEVTSVALSAVGGRIASASRDRTVRVWEIDTGKELITLEGHAGDVTCVAFSADGSRIASGSLDKTVRVWDAETGKSLQTFRGHSKAVESVAFSGNRWIASAGADETVQVWDAATGKIWCKLQGHIDTVRTVASCGAVVHDHSWAMGFGLEFGLGRANTTHY